MARCRLIALGALSLALFMGASEAQEPLDASPCDLVSNPQKFADQVIRVRAEISLAFEDFTLEIPNCGDKFKPIWLAYGGDEPTPTVSTVNDGERKPGSVMKVNGRAITLEHDAALELFKRRLGAQRIGGVGGSDCYGRTCYLYNVTATVTGVFFAAVTKAGSISGYGHLGCCHLLVLQKIADVDVQRTSVPAGGQFSCSTEHWSVNAADAERLRKLVDCPGDKDCRETTRNVAVAIAAHWNQTIDPDRGSVSGFYEGAPLWRSDDLLQSYSMRFQYPKGHDQEGAPTGATASRTQCKATIPPYSLTTPIGCRNVSGDFPAARDKAGSIQEQPGESRRLGSAAAAAQAALPEASALWGVELAHNLKLSKCSKPMDLEGDQVSWCNWTDPNSMQEISVAVAKLRSLRHGRDWSSVPWLPKTGSGFVCVAEN